MKMDCNLGVPASSPMHQVTRLFLKKKNNVNTLCGIVDFLYSLKFGHQNYTKELRYETMLPES